MLKRAEVAAEVYAKFIRNKVRTLVFVLLASLLPIVLDGEATEFGSNGGGWISVEVGIAVETTHV